MLVWSETPALIPAANRLRETTRAGRTLWARVRRRRNQISMTAEILELALTPRASWGRKHGVWKAYTIYSQLLVSWSIRVTEPNIYRSGGWGVYKEFLSGAYCSLSHLDCACRLMASWLVNTVMFKRAREIAKLLTAAMACLRKQQLVSESSNPPKIQPARRNLSD